MSIKKSLCKGPETDDLDNARINRLIARYSYIREACEEQQVGDFKTDRNYATNTNPVFGQSTSPIQAYPMMDNYLYKIHGNDSAGKDNDDGNFIKLTCDYPYYDSFHSRSFDTESSTPKTGHKFIKIDDKSKTKVTFQDQIKNVDQQTSFTGEEFLSKKCYAEKTTYCRPVSKTYDNHFVHGVIEKNAKLQLLLTKFVIARQKEKEKDKWNAYVQNLMEKRRRYMDLSTHLLPPRKLQQEINPLLVRNVYSTKNKLTDSYQEILQEMYSPRNELYVEKPPESEEGNTFYNNTIGSTYDKELHCFPSTSRGIKKNVKNHDIPRDRTLYGSSVVICNKKKPRRKAPKTEKYFDIKPPRQLTPEMSPCQIDSISDIKPEIKESKDVQTYITFGGYSNLASYFKNELEPRLRVTVSEIHVAIRDKNDTEEKVKSKETHDKATACIDELNEITQSSKLTPIQNMMREDLENQLEILVSLFNSFISDFKRKGILSDDNLNNRVVDTSDSNESSNSAQNNTSKASKKKKKNKKNVTIVGNVMTNTSLCGFGSQDITSQHFLNSRLEEKLDKIMYDELDKSNKLKKEIEAMLNHTTHRQCAVQISSDIPTKERSTEVTDSLSKTKLSECQSKTISIKDVSFPTDCCIGQSSQKFSEKRHCAKSQRRVAVNTEPMGLQALLKFSTEAVKQILSFVPNMNRWHLPDDRLPAPQCANYVCNVCGVLFARQSQLCAHILEHNLGEGRRPDGCESRRALHPQPKPGFRCEYCGQRFQRSYCCELHQHTCSRKLGRRHNSSGLVMLR